MQFNFNDRIGERLRKRYQTLYYKFVTKVYLNNSDHRIDAYVVIFLTSAVFIAKNEMISRLLIFVNVEFSLRLAYNIPDEVCNLLKHEILQKIKMQPTPPVPIFIFTTEMNNKLSTLHTNLIIIFKLHSNYLT